jgi:hypothetical protein
MVNRAISAQELDPDDIFDALANDIAAAMNLAPLEPQGRGDPVRFMDIRLSGMESRIEFDRETAEDTLFISCVFGSPPSRHRAESMLALLEANANTLFNSAGFFMNESGEVAYMLQWPLAPGEAEEMIDVLRQVAGQAAIWRRTSFLAETEETPEATMLRI